MQALQLGRQLPPLSKLVVPGSSAITMRTVTVSSLEGEKWVVWHTETKGSIVSSFQSEVCSLSYLEVWKFLSLKMEK